MIVTWLVRMRVLLLLLTVRRLLRIRSRVRVRSPVRSREMTQRRWLPLVDNLPTIILRSLNKYYYSGVVNCLVAPPEVPIRMHRVQVMRRVIAVAVTRKLSLFGLNGSRRRMRVLLMVKMLLMVMVLFLLVWIRLRLLGWTRLLVVITFLVAMNITIVRSRMRCRLVLLIRSLVFLAVGTWLPIVDVIRR